MAQATPPGRSGIAVVRLSGPVAGDALRALHVTPIPEPRRAVLAALRNPETRAVIDRALVLWFPAPHSFTGEDVAELHVHGSLAVLQALTRALLTLPGVRLAEPGEFARRAFENGKMDLTEAEGLADLIDAETERQRMQAVRQMEGEAHRHYGRWRTQILEYLALLEAYIDFPDEDIPNHVLQEIDGGLAALREDMAKSLAVDRQGERIREGIQGVIIGPPNAGKSTLLNALAKREVAIVSDIAGTTRDVLEVRLDIAGYPVLLADTAGMRESDDQVEIEGVRRARARAESADFTLLVVDATAEPATQNALIAAECRPNTLILYNKIDIAPSIPMPEAAQNLPALGISPVTGEGMNELTKILQALIASVCDSSEPALITRERHRHQVKAAHTALKTAAQSLPLELRCEELRQAASAIGRITGAIGVEDVLDVVFSRFCIGK